MQVLAHWQKHEWPCYLCNITGCWVLCAENVAVEQAVCTLLLGDTMQAMRMLQRTREHGSMGVVHFLAEFGSSWQEQVEGTCAFCEEWVRRVLQPALAGSWSRESFDLHAWAQQRRVRAAVAQQKMPLYALIQRELSCRSCVVACSVAWDSPGYGYVRLLLESQRGHSQRAHVQVQKYVAAQKMPTTLRIPVHAVQRCAAGVMRALSMLSSRLFGPAMAGACLSQAVSLQSVAMTAPYSQLPGSSMVGGTTRQPMSGFLRMMAVLAGIFTAAAAVFTFRMLAERRVSAPQGASGIQVSMAAAAFEHQHTAAKITADEARTTIYAWIEAKKLAFGPQHDVSALNVVLDGPMLQEWQEKAAESSEQDWHWHYQPSDIVVRPA